MTIKKEPVHIKIKIMGTSTVWPKWQIVIPKSIREDLSITPGDSVLFLYNREKWQVWFIRNDNLQDVLDYVSSRWIRIDID